MPTPPKSHVSNKQLQLTQTGFIIRGKITVEDVKAAAVKWKETLNNSEHNPICFAITRILRSRNIDCKVRVEFSRNQLLVIVPATEILRTTLMTEFGATILPTMQQFLIEQLPINSCPFPFALTFSKLGVEPSP